MTATADATTRAEMGLFARAIGVVTSPRATFEAIVAHPRPVGILFASALVIGLATGLPQFTTSGQEATIQAQVDTTEQFLRRPLNNEEYDGLRNRARFGPYFAVVGVLVATPIFSLIFTALYWVVFNTVLGGAAAFKQVLAVVTHTQVLTALQYVVGAPIQYMQDKVTQGGPFNLGALVPMLDESSTLARFLGATSVFTVWGLIVTAIGFAVLYRRKSVSIAIGLLIAYGVIGYTLTSVFSSFMGGSSSGR